MFNANDSHNSWVLPNCSVHLDENNKRLHVYDNDSKSQIIIELPGTLSVTYIRREIHSMKRKVKTSLHLVGFQLSNFAQRLIILEKGGAIAKDISNLLSGYNFRV